MGKSYAVIGLGRFGMSVARELQERGGEVVALDINEEKVMEVADLVSKAFEVRANDAAIIKELGPENLSGVIICISEDLGKNLMLTMEMLELGIANIYVKAQSEDHKKLLIRMGIPAKNVILPERDGGAALARWIVGGAFAERIHLTEETAIVKRPVVKKWVGKTVTAVGEHLGGAVKVMAIAHEDTAVLEPEPAYVFAAGDLVVLAGDRETIEKMEVIL